MNKEHKDILRRNQSFLVKNLTTQAIEDICDRLLENGILSSGIKDNILNKAPKPHAQTRELLSTLPRRGPNAFSSFTDALNQTGNEFILEKLLECQEKPKSFAEKKTLHEKPKVVEQSSCTNITEWPDLTKNCSNLSQKDIQKTTEDNCRKILETHSREKVYELSKTKKGKFIFLYNTCKPCDEDEHANRCLYNLDWDKTTLELLFKYTGFDRKVAMNKSGQGMKKYVKQETLDDNYDSLILVILCGGIDFEPSKIYDGNGYEVSLDEIVDIIKDSQTFKDKPKIVILQTYSFKGMKTQLDELDSKMERLKLDKENTEDLFVVAAYPKKGCDPWMRGNNAKGSYFIQSLAYVMKNHCHTMSFVEMMKEVHKCLSNVVTPVYVDKKETPQTTKKAVAEVDFVTKCSLKELFIFPGIHTRKT